MNAVIVYDRFVLAAKANAMLDRAAYRADLSPCWKISSWQVDMLHRSLTAHLAFKDAQGADVLVLAVQNQSTLPAWLLDWLENWAQHRLVKDAAVGVFDGTGAGDALSVFAAPALSQFAQRHGLSLIFSEVCPLADKIVDALPGDELVPSVARFAGD